MNIRLIISLISFYCNQNGRGIGQKNYHSLWTVVSLQIIHI